MPQNPSAALLAAVKVRDDQILHNITESMSGVNGVEVAAVSQNLGHKSSWLPAT